MRTRPFRLGRSPLIALVAGLALPGLLVAQEPAAGTHTVRRGDTLWDIARQYLGDPVRWPEIYRLNTDVVEDPHWIYPDEVLRLVGGPGVAAVPGPGVAAAAADTVRVEPLAPGGLRPADTVLAVAGPVYDDDVDMTPLFGRSRDDAEEAMAGYLARTIRPLRKSEFNAAGFLTEGGDYQLGTVRGNVVPTELGSDTYGPGIRLHTRIGIRPPAQGAYQIGDTLLVVEERAGFGGHGSLMVPSAMAVVVEVNDPETVARVIQMFGEVMRGQRTVMAEPFQPGPETHPVPVTGGLEARLLGMRDEGHAVAGTQDVVFIDRGRADGVAPGDIFEIRRGGYDREPMADTVDDVMAVMQVVRVGENSSAGKIIHVVYPKLESGLPVRQVGRLPS